MDPLNWLLITWLAVAAFIFVVMQKITEIWPPTAVSQTVFLPPKGATFPDADHSPDDQNISYAKRFSQLTNQIRENLTAKIMPHLQMEVTSAANHGSSPASYEESVQWLNEFLTWFFRYYRGKVTFLDAWCRALNDAAKKLAATTGYDIIFEEIKPVENKTVPNLSNVRTEKGPRESLNIRCQICVSTISFKFVASQKVQDKMIVSNHVAKLYDLEGQLQTRLVCMGGELFAMMCFDGQPHLTMDLTQNDTESAENMDRNTLQQVIRRCLSSGIVNMSFLDYHQQLADVRENGTPKAKDGQLSPDRGSTPSQVEQYNRLLVKILRAEALQEIIHFTEPYVIVELDEPPQKHTTTLAHGTDPMWDEHFLFDIDQQKSQELLFEVYGKSNDPEIAKDASSTHQKFLGLAIISIEEIRQSAITRHALNLQPRPYIKDKVSGTLFVECLFVYASKQDHDEDFLFQELEVHMKHHGGHITTAYANRDNEMLVLKIPELNNAKALDNIGCFDVCIFQKPRSSSSSNIMTSDSKKLPYKMQQKAASCSTSPNRCRGKTPESTTLDGRGLIFRYFLSIAFYDHQALLKPFSNLEIQSKLTIFNTKQC
uniref:C2 domain-containing protein n=1 Tax=Romanomermis culicivorax TaxID=13658 RepID=A0A915J5N9_ROMCU